MPIDYNKLTWKTVNDAVLGRVKDCHRINRSLFDGDHWLSGEGWIGPKVSAKSTGSTSEIGEFALNEIERVFVSKNSVKEVTRRHKNGSISREPAWSFTLKRPMKEGQAPSAKEQALIDEAEQALAIWFDKRGIHRLLQKLVVTLLLEERAAIRLFIPSGLTKNGVVPAGDLNQQLDRIFVMHPSTSNCTVLRDDTTQQEVGVYLYSVKQQDVTKHLAEVTHTNETGQTLIRILSQETDNGNTTTESRASFTDAEQQEAMLELGGSLTIFEIERDALITEQARRLQYLINLALTMMEANTVQGGFLQKIFMNAQMPGKWIDDPDDKSPPGNRKKKKFIPDPFHIGVGMSAFVTGLTKFNQDGTPADVMNPSLQVIQPSDPATFTKTADYAYEALLQETHQLHALISGDATPSGESRRQAMADFIEDLFSTKVLIDELGRWLMETVLHFASYFAGQPNRFEALRCNFEARINPGPISSEEQSMIIDLLNNNVISMNTARVRVGIVDPDAEQVQIDEYANRNTQPDTSTSDANEDDDAVDQLNDPDAE